MKVSETRGQRRKSREKFRKGLRKLLKREDARKGENDKNWDGVKWIK